MRERESERENESEKEKKIRVGKYHAYNVTYTVHYGAAQSTISKLGGQSKINDPRYEGNATPAAKRSERTSTLPPYTYAVTAIKITIETVSAGLSLKYREKWAKIMSEPRKHML